MGGRKDSTCARLVRAEMEVIVHRNVEHRSPRMPRSLGFAGLALGALLITASLSQCRRVEDRITGVEFGPSSGTARSDCVRQCYDAFKAARAAETDRHRQALQACGTDKVCRKNEDTLYKNNLQALFDQLQDCKRNCYNEGAAGGGR